MEEREYKILVVDDDAVVRSSFEALLKHLGYNVIAVDDGERAFNFCKTDPDIDLIFMDIYMPNISGFDTIKLINSIRNDIPIIIITGESTMENAIEAIKIGAYDFVPKPITNYKILDIVIRRALGYRNQLLKEKQYKNDLQNEIQKKTDLLSIKNEQLESNVRNFEEIMVEVISSFTEMMEQKDPYLIGHTRNVVGYCNAFARILHLNEREMQLLEFAAKLHDIGKIVLPESILNKPGKYSDEEWVEMKQHPNIAATILKPLEFMTETREVIQQHHERYDGHGYPQGLAGENIN
ncbi:MAG: response regulator [Candidatus Marinimicrobia bacterium]|nr:response regulator [Candidatus Neomarinimicrobiota bacterium]